MKSVFRNIFRKALKIINLMTLERQHASLEIIIRKAKIRGERIVVFLIKYCRYHSVFLYYFFNIIFFMILKKINFFNIKMIENLPF